MSFDSKKNFDKLKKCPLAPSLKVIIHLVQPQFSSYFTRYLTKMPVVLNDQVALRYKNGHLCRVIVQ